MNSTAEGAVNSTARGIVIGIDRLKETLPHRYPMLLVDRVTTVEPGVSLTAIKAITANEPWYAQLPEYATEDDHAYPVALLVESWCQAAGVLALWEQAGPEELADLVMLFGSISGIQVHGRALPGSLVEHRVRHVRSVGTTLIFEGESLLDGAPLLTVGSIVITMRPGGELAADGDNTTEGELTHV
ncbi:3-hydroxyacyl-ACP dehydratase FabZ family protein [Streptomyces xiangluensis]|uniref:3-hydroxyacyl-ACP dehydratase FabZ family protein n=1 Tax=Streptomyces xiangluensis TaxID=2665720 RepID=A0ABV8YT29_9ACTN